MGRGLALAALIVLAPSLLHAQQVTDPVPSPTAPAVSATDSVLNLADAAAQASRHVEAIGLYQRAAELDPTLRVPLLPKLARQHLWAGETARAVDLFAAYLTEHPTECEPRIDYALALSWANRLTESRDEYRAVAARCPDQKSIAIVGEGRVLRWDNRIAAARSVYEDFTRNAATPADKEQAELGRALVALQAAEPRASRAISTPLVQAATRNSEVITANAQAMRDLGQEDRSLELIRISRDRGVTGADMDDLEKAIRISFRPLFNPQTRVFRDSDGTEQAAAGGTLSLRLPGGGHLEGNYEASRLFGSTGSGDTIDAQSGSIAIDRRLSETVAINLRLGLKDFGGLDFRKVDGEAGLVLLPGDHTRFDLGYARVMITDNVAALNEQLIGNYVGVGWDQRFNASTAMSVSAAATRWSVGNTRGRVSLGFRHRLDGVPQITLWWPTSFQWYSESFQFGLWSPKAFLESGPAITIEQRYNRVWYAVLYARVGVAGEPYGSANPSWTPLGHVFGWVERELGPLTGIRLEATWANSNLSSQNAFRRTAVYLRLTRRL